MKPVAIFRFAETEGPGYFATFLDQHSIPWQLFSIDRNQPIPARADYFSGIALMGGPMSVNDPLPWIGHICELIVDADAKSIPVIGHCLGAQLMSKAFGARVFRNPVKEIGWGRVDIETSPTARHWLGDQDRVVVFQWHGETFELPEGAQRLARSADCLNQMYSLRNHFGMQCHIEMTEAMIADWCRAWPAEIEGLAALPASIQTPAQMISEAQINLPELHDVGHRVYSRWISALDT